MYGFQPEFVADPVEDGLDLVLVLFVLDQLVHLRDGVLAQQTVRLVADALKEKVKIRIRFRLRLGLEVLTVENSISNDMRPLRPRYRHVETESISIPCYQKK
jgi:hypothetical protein